MKQKLGEIQQSLDWIERLDITNDPAPPPGGIEPAEEEGDQLANNDFKRELRL